MPRPCDGLRVVDFTHSYPGALATMVLADAGAEVIHIEPPGGDPVRKHYAWPMWLRGKKSVLLDLKRPAERDEARKLAAQADVVVESWRPGVADRLGVGYSDLAKGNPGLVYCGITGYGPRGPLAQRRAYEHEVHAKTGRTDMFWGMYPPKADGPIYSSQPLLSYCAAMLAIQGTLAALVVRQACGKGQKVETTLLQALTCYDLMGFLTYQLAEQTGEVIRRGYPGGGIPPYMTARSKDGHWLQFANLTVDTLRNFLRVTELQPRLKEPRFADVPKYANLDDESAFHRVVLERIQTKTRDEWMKIFIENDCAAEPFRTTQQGLQHPQAIHNG
ncbi:MAG: CoA transferase, partial [Chloroflexi bacterium]|nr:CoA transferase [Chloroflexota bacterium]